MGIKYIFKFFSRQSFNYLNVVQNYKKVSTIDTSFRSDVPEIRSSSPSEYYKLLSYFDPLRYAFDSIHREHPNLGIIIPNGRKIFIYINSEMVRFRMF